MSLISLVRKINEQDKTGEWTSERQAIEGINRVCIWYGHLDIYRADRLMLRVAAKEVLCFDIKTSAEARACNAILEYLKVPESRFMYSGRGILLLTPNRVDDKDSYSVYIKEKHP